MGFLSMLFGCGDGDDRFHSEADYQRNLAHQTEMTPQTVDQLRSHGVGPDSMLRLEFFFYTDTDAKASKLASVLQGLGYDVEHVEAADGNGSFLVNGWTTRLRMDTPGVVSWTREMCNIGYSHDAEFDGWGTNPEQEQTTE